MAKKEQLVEFRPGTPEGEAFDREFERTQRAKANRAARDVIAGRRTLSAVVGPIAVHGYREMVLSRIAELGYDCDPKTGKVTKR